MIWNESLFEQLANQDWAYTDTALSADTAAQWLHTLQKRQSEASFREAQIAFNQTEKSIRSDQIHWLEPFRSDEAQILKSLNEGRQIAQETLRVSMPELEAHFAIYPAGSFYKRHCDQPKGKFSRVLTFVVYLHTHWDKDLGGELVITDGDSDQVLHVIEPKPKRVVVFKSDEVWHEVRKSSFDRYSLTGWFRHELGSFTIG